MSAPRRIVCLCPSITEALFAIGAGPRVVGVTEYCVHPREAVEALPKVGGSKLPDLDALFALRPDLVVMNEEENRIEDHDEIAARGIPIHDTFPKKVIDTAAMMRGLGRAVGCETEAENVASAVEAAVADAKNAEAKNAAAGKPKIRAVALVWMRPFMAVNGDTFMHDMMELAGFANVCGSRPERYPRLEKEEIQSARRELGLEAILLPNEPFEFVPQHATEIAALAGLPTQRAVLCDGQFFSWYGSRTPRGLEAMRKLAERVRAFPPLDGPR
jgi:ABC-type Fe3+-hydroxamate transport system substrate-binding protein